MKPAVSISAMLLGAYAAMAQVTVTVYNQDLGLVKETRLVEVQKGVFTFEASDVAALIDPTSVHLKLPGAEVFDTMTWRKLVLGEKVERFTSRTTATKRSDPWS